MKEPSGFDQGAWDAITRLQNAKALDVECRRVLEFLLPRLGLSKADLRDSHRILAGKQPYRKAGT